MPEDETKEELEAMRIQVQTVMQLRGGGTGRREGPSPDTT
jgi:hypothetical protein